MHATPSALSNIRGILFLSCARTVNAHPSALKKWRRLSVMGYVCNGNIFRDRELIPRAGFSKFVLSRAFFSLFCRAIKRATLAGQYGNFTAADTRSRIWPCQARRALCKPDSRKLNIDVLKNRATQTTQVIIFSRATFLARHKVRSESNWTVSSALFPTYFSPSVLQQ